MKKYIMKKYIMTPVMFEQFKSVREFSNVNGKTYQEHICIIFNDKLTEQQKKYILQCKTYREALEYLYNITPYTHTYTIS